MVECLVNGIESGRLLLAVALLAGSFIDIRYMVVPLPLAAAIAAIGWGFRAFSGNLMEWDTILSLVPGMVMMIGSKLSRGHLGSGDAWMVLAIGTLLDFQSVVVVIWWAFWIAGLLALFVFLIRRKKEIEIPFVPFLFLGYAICMTVR